MANFTFLKIALQAVDQKPGYHLEWPTEYMNVHINIYESVKISVNIGILVIWMLTIKTHPTVCRY